MISSSRWSLARGCRQIVASPSRAHRASSAGRRLLTVFVLLVAAGCAERTRPATAPALPSSQAAAHLRQLQQDLNGIFGAPAFERAQWAAVVQSIGSGEYLYRLNASKLVMPASNMKIVTLSVAAQRLGWDYVFETRVLATGPVEQGVLNGDLLIVGGGDPSINSRPDSPRGVFDAWADLLRTAGVATIDGRIVGDDRAFEVGGLGNGWAWDDLAYGYAAPVGALQYNENAVQVIIRPAPVVGGLASVTLRPGGSGLSVECRVVTSEANEPANVVERRLPGSGELVVAGRVPIGSPDIVRTASVDSPAQFFVQALHDALVADGIVVRHPPVRWTQLAEAPDPARGRVLFTHRSAPLSEIATVLMKVSQNLYAETLLKTLGKRTGTGTVADGRSVLRDVLDAWGVPADSYVLADGSGLSRYNYVTADTLVLILRLMATDPRHAAAFEATLPVAGADGTMAHRMQGTRAEGNARAKTGSIANVRSLSGYVTTLDGERLAFSIVANHFNVLPDVVDGAIDAAVERLASHSRK
jgi:serine-type D-Ala-D-Ala carboxypeptidase/endopeptidase (penicillin-binding protein 4)